MTKRIFVTGAAGFIGFHLCLKLIKNNFNVIGLDNLNNYYDPNLKKKRLDEIEKVSKLNGNWHFYKGDLEDLELLIYIFKKNSPSIVINLAAQAGVRFSIDNPSKYISSNLVGFSNILECCRNFNIRHLLYASSSSVYGGNKKQPFSENDNVDHPISLYAATKRSNELLAHTYSHLYNIPSTSLRFFTVYGPWGRPDMAPMIFTNAILNNKKINIFNNGLMVRDFTFISDVVNAIYLLIDKIPASNSNTNTYDTHPSKSWAPFRILNIGNSTPINLMDFISNIEKELGIEAKKEFMAMQKGDVQNTLSDTFELQKLIGFKPQTTLKNGIKKFINWYKDFYII